MKRRLLVDVEINVKDESYDWFLYWMALHQRGQLAARNGAAGATSAHGESTARGGVMESIIKRFTPGVHHLSIATEKRDLPNGSVQTTFALLPGPGKHVLRYKNAFLLVNRMRETKSMDFQKGKPWETVTLTTLYSQRHIFDDLFREAHQLAQKAIEGKTIVYHPESVSWTKFGEPRRKRGLDSVILDQGIKESITEDVKDFLGSSKWYYDRGIPYRRGYLLHGPPGSGKTSFIQALAGELDYNIAMLNLSTRGLTDDRLNMLLSVIPKRTLVLLEDADAAFANRRVQTDSHGYSGANVTFSGLLNALDGVASAEERILFLTTNYPERMDAALIRPGRVDMTVRLGDATRYQVERFWDRFYGDLDVNGHQKALFLAKLEHLGVIEGQDKAESEVPHQTSTAALQGLFLYNKGNMQGAIDMAEGLVPREVREANIESQGASASG
jgi:chaperone BCS1